MEEFTIVATFEAKFFSVILSLLVLPFILHSLVLYLTFLSTKPSIDLHVSFSPQYLQSVAILLVSRPSFSPHVNEVFFEQSFFFPVILCYTIFVS